MIDPRIAKALNLQDIGDLFDNDQDEQRFDHGNPLFIFVLIGALLIGIIIAVFSSNSTKSTPRSGRSKRKNSSTGGSRSRSSSARTRRNSTKTKKSKSEIQAERLKNLAKARRAKKRKSK